MTQKQNARAASREPSVLALIEDAAHLLRRAPAGVWLFHFLGAGAWVLGVLFAWAHVSWFRPSRDEIALGACALVALYAWLKVAQAEMCARLMAQRLGTAPRRFTWRRAARLAASQFATHAWGPAALLVSGLLVVPFSRAWLYFQNTTVLGAAEKPGAPGDDAMALARLWPHQAVSGLLIMTLFAFVVFINVAAAFYLLPELARTLLGVENIMAVSGWSMFNTTFLMCVCGLAWFVVDPLAKAFCVLRVFHGRALRTGEDLSIEMDAAGIARRAVSLVAAVVVLAGAAVFSGNSLAADEPQQTHETPADQQVRPAELNRAIDEVLERRDFQWQLQPEKKTKASGDGEPGAITRFFNWLGRGLRSIGEGVASFLDWLVEKLSGEKRDAPEEEPVAREAGTRANGAVILKILLVVIGAILAGLLVWVCVGAWRGRSREDAVEAGAVDIAGEATPDLADENAHAAQLPSDGWLRLAREQAARGDWRLALRALYLAHLARLDAGGLITLRRHKTNLDYERELRRRALQRAELASWFAARRREFEEAWYGRAQPDEARVRAWFDEVEKGAEALS